MDNHTQVASGDLARVVGMLEVRGVSKHYGLMRVLTDVSLSASVGEVVALVGENGAGKSTLVRCIARALAADSGTIAIAGTELGRTPRDAIANGLAVVWQDLALCENLDVTANLFLGRELNANGALRTAAMRSRAAGVFEELHVTVPELNRPIEQLSGGQRQLVAIARATLDHPRVLILDEPTAALGIAESRTVLEVLRTLRHRGVCLVFVSHQLDEVFDVADRIAVMRHGQIVADLHRAETHRDDVVAMINGVDVDSTAGQQLRRLHSLAEQLADADQSSVLPITVSSLSAALSTDRMALLMIDDADGNPLLQLSAALHLPAALAEQLSAVSLGEGTFIARAASEESLLVVPQLRDMPNDTVAQAGVRTGLAGAWAAPIVGQYGTLAVIVGFTDTVTQLQQDQSQLLELFTTMAGVAVERGRLLETLAGRNRALEGLRGVLETLAGPDLPRSGMAVALDSLCAGVSSDAAMLLVADGDGWARRAVSSAPLVGIVADRMQGAPMTDASILVTEFDWSRGRAALVCRWLGTAPEDARQVMDGAANSFRLAMERELILEAHQEAAALQRSRKLERQLTRRIGHELRTPLTAIKGFASSMLQPDVEWPEAEKRRCLEIIENEASRMGRLVAQMFDDSALESGMLRLALDYCDLVAVVKHAANIAAPSAAPSFDLPDQVEVWGDSDRLEQVFVNLIGNAVRHNKEGTVVALWMAPPSAADSHVVVEVFDDGEGMPKDARDYLNGVVDQRDRDRGLGLRLVRGLVDAHGGTVRADIGAHGGGTTVRVSLPFETAESR